MDENLARVSDYYSEIKYVFHLQHNRMSRTVVMAENSPLEKKIEEALQGGKCGVLVTLLKIRVDSKKPEETYIFCEIDENVPYGEVHEQVKEVG